MASLRMMAQNGLAYENNDSSKDAVPTDTATKKPDGKGAA